MASSQTSSNDISATNDKGVKGSVEGRVYEKLSLLLLAKNGYEISKDNAKFRDFSIGKEIGLGRDVKFDDNVFRYTDGGTTKNFIFVQVKHIQRDHQIDSRDLSVEAARAKRGRGGGKSREFNLQKYFISYLSVREELKSATSEEYRNGKITYVAIFTNAGLDTEELLRKGFSLEEAPDDIIKLFTLKTQEPKDFYQLSNISKDLNEILMKSSDLHRMAKELAQYVVWKNHREKNIMKKNESPMKHYHVPLAREVIRKSDQVENKSSKKQTKNEEYCEAQFRDEFLENDETGSKQELLNAVFEAIRGLDESKKSFSDDQLKNLLKGIKWKIVPNFGETEETKDINLPSEWKTVKEEDITDFLKCLVLIVNQPRVNELQTHFLSSVQDTVVDRHYNTTLREIIHQLDNTGPELRELIEQDLGIYETTNFEEKWTSGHKVVEFLDEQKQQISLSFFVTAMTLIYESEVMQFGKFSESEKMKKCLDNFFSSNAKILGVKTSQTLLSSIKILHYLNSKKDYIAEDSRIYLNLDILKSKENRDNVAKAFELERNVLLVIEYRHTVNEHYVEEFYKKLYSVVNAKPNQKIIIIIPEEEHNILLENFKNDFQNKDNFMLEYDVIDIKYFEPKEDPFKKEVIIFQGQNKRVTLSDITGIDRWNSYVHSLSQGTNEQGVIDGMTLVKILNNDEIEVGSKPAGTSSLEGAYAQMYEEINVETLINKLTSQGYDNNANDMYIISGITGSNEGDKTDKLIRCLGRDYENEEFKNRLKIPSVKILNFLDDPFKDKDFRTYCHNYPEKRIFWICLVCENNGTKLVLRSIYNPKFYLKRKFKNVIIKKDLKEYLIKDDLSETFIFYCDEDKRELYNIMDLNEHEIKLFESNCVIRIFSKKSDAEADFELVKQTQTVHLIEFEAKQFFWRDSHGAVQNLQKYIDHEESKRYLVEEDNLIRKIKDRKVVILADDPGMGKTTTLIKLYDTENESSSIIKSHWVIRIQLRDNLKHIWDLEFKKHSIDIGTVVEFLSKIDIKLNSKLAKNLLAMAFDKDKYFPKSLLLAFDGFDEVLDDKCRKKIVSLFKFLKYETAAKLWVTTRLHYKQILENELSDFSIEFMPIDDEQKEHYIRSYLHIRLYLTLKEEKYTELFDNNDKKQDNQCIQTYITAFLYKMKSIFRGDITRFIGTPLQLSLMLEGSARHFKNWIEISAGEIPVFNYIGNDIYEIYEKFIDRKYDVYFQKKDNRECAQRGLEKFSIDRYHKDFAVSKILQVNSDDDFEQFTDIFLLVGVIKSDGNDLEFIHKTFEEFFASKVFFDCIKRVPDLNKQEYLLTDILRHRYYQFVRTFINLQLEKLSEHATEGDGWNGLNGSLKHYGKTLSRLLSEENSPLIDVYGTPLLRPIEEGNKSIACFLLNSFKEHSDVLKKLLFNACVYREITSKFGYVRMACCTDNDVFGQFDYPWRYTVEGTALHLACREDDFEIVKVLLNAAAGISEDTLQDFLKCLNENGENALRVTVKYSHNILIFKELLNRMENTNGKLKLILQKRNVLVVMCGCDNEACVEFLLQIFKNDKHCLKQLLLLYDGYNGNALSYASSITVVEKLIYAAKSIEDNNETLKNFLLPEEDQLPFNEAVSRGKIDVVEKLINAAKEIDDDNHTLKQLLLTERNGYTALHDAAAYGRDDIIKLLLETAANLDILEKLITDKKRENVIHLMVEKFQMEGAEDIFADFFKMLEEDKYQNIRKKVKKMFENVPLESRLCIAENNLHMAVRRGDTGDVKAILNNVKKSSVSPNESLRLLLLAKGGYRRMAVNVLYISCELENLEIIKGLLSCAMNIDDGGATLRELLTETKPRHIQAIKQIIDSLIFEAENSNRMHAVNILKYFKEGCTEVKPSSERLKPPSVRLNFFQRIFARIRPPFRKIKL